MADNQQDKVTRRRFVTNVAGGAALLPGAAPGTAAGQQSTEARTRLGGEGYPRRFTGASLSQIAFPLGGIGTGTISLGGRGQLRDWEIFNRPGKGDSPQFGFFAIRAQAGSQLPDARVLERRILPPYQRPGLWRGLGFYNLPGLPRFAEAEFEGDYPFARIRFLDDDFPVSVSLEAFNPMVPLDVDASSFPVAVLRYTVRNTGSEAATVSIAYSQQNPAGGQGHQCELRKGKAITGLLLSDPFLGEKDPLWGTFAVALRNDEGPAEITHLRRWHGPFSRDWALTFWNDFKDDGRLTEPGEAGRSRISSLCVGKRIAAGSEAVFTFLLSWHFPNRTPARCGWRGAKGHEHDLIGNYYCTQFRDAWEAAEQAAENLPSLEARTRRFVQTVKESTLPPVVLDAAMSNISTLRTNTCFRTADGNFYGFEGCRDDAGCCFGNCTHVWNYEQATGFLFPPLARNMRESEFGPALDEQGLMSFRQLLPPGIERTGLAAADGQMGAVMRLYREWQLSGDTEWLRRIWPRAKKALAFCWLENSWDADQDGVMEGVQHNTYDIEFFGPNPLCTGLYLGALRAAEKMARACGDDSFAARCRELFERGRRWMDENLFAGDHYVQQIRPIARDRIRKGLMGGPGNRQRPEDPVHQAGDGCLIDQLLGQSIAHVLGLGYLLDKNNVRASLRAIMRYNFRDNLVKHESVERVFALNDEAAVLMCSYPKGKPPAFPFWFYQEMWTGSEYQLAAHLFSEGMIEEGLKVVTAVRQRFDGQRRNPWNEQECGHHYARAMASWALIPALSGFLFSAVSRTMAFHPRPNQETFRTFWSAGTGWGTFSQQRSASGQRAELMVTEGSLELKTLGLALTGGAKVSARLDNKPLTAAAKKTAAGIEITFSPVLRLKAGQRLTVAL